MLEFSLITSCLVYIQVQIMPSLPLILFGSMSMIAGMLSLIFPETLGTKLPDTVWEAENIGESKSNETREIPDLKNDTKTRQVWEREEERNGNNF